MLFDNETSMMIWPIFRSIDLLCCQQNIYGGFVNLEICRISLLESEVRVFAVAFSGCGCIRLGFRYRQGVRLFMKVKICLCLQVFYSHKQLQK